MSPAQKQLLKQGIKHLPRLGMAGWGAYGSVTTMQNARTHFANGDYVNAALSATSALLGVRSTAKLIPRNKPGVQDIASNQVPSHSPVSTLKNTADNKLATSRTTGSFGSIPNSSKRTFNAGAKNTASSINTGTNRLRNQRAKSSDSHNSQSLDSANLPKYQPEVPKPKASSAPTLDSSNKLNIHQPTKLDVDSTKNSVPEPEISKPGSTQVPTSNSLDTNSTPQSNLKNTNNAPASNDFATKNPQIQETLRQGLPRDLQGRVPIEVSSDLTGNTVRVHYEVDKNGLVTNIHMRVGSQATAIDIQLHAQTVRLMQRYSGFSGRIQILQDRIAGWIKRNGVPPVGSRAWEAKLEVEKLPRIIQERLNRLSKGGLDESAEAALRDEIESLEFQLAKHKQTLDQMDANPGSGFVAAADLHNHYNGVISPQKLVDISKFQGDYEKAFEEIHTLFFGEITKELENLQGFMRKSRRKEMNFLYTYLQQQGIIDATGKIIQKPDAQVAKQIIDDLLSSTNGTPFNPVYKFRDLMDAKPSELDKAVLEELKLQGVEYAELQRPPVSMKREIFHQPDVPKVWFLRLSSGKEKLAAGGTVVPDQNQKSRKNQNDNKNQNGDETQKVEKNGTERLGKGRTVGIDFAGAEEKEFTEKGMKYWRDMHSKIKEKAQSDTATYVYRTHVGEGYPQRDAQAQILTNSNHREIANHNVGMVVKTLEQMAAAGELSQNVVVRLGHVTHADFEQLQRLEKLSREHGIIVEANLTSNLVTGSVANKDEMQQVLLKFMHNKDLKVTLNTDGGGVMGTNLPKEYGIAQEAIDEFKSGKTPIVDEKGKVIYYYDKKQIPAAKDRKRGYDHRAIPEDEREQIFSVERLKEESERYIKEIAPNIGSEKQRGVGSKKQTGKK